MLRYNSSVLASAARHRRCPRRAGATPTLRTLRPPLLALALLCGLVLATTSPVMASDIWVDLFYTGTESGTETEPYNTVGEALAAAGSGDTIKIKGDSWVTASREAPLTFHDVTIEAVNGDITLAAAPTVIEPLPSPVFIAPGDSRDLSCVVSSDTGPFTYQWQASADGTVGSWSNLSDTSKITGTTSSTLHFDTVWTLPYSYYRCWVRDTYGPPIKYSNAVYLAIISCDPFEPPPGDFTTLSGFAAWQEVDLLQWERDGSLTRFRTCASPSCSGTFGTISRTGVSVPVTHSKVRITFPSLDKDLDVRFSWGSGVDESCTFEVSSSPPIHQECDATVSTANGYVVTFDVKPSWHDGSGVNGFYSRDLSLDFLNGGSSVSSVAGTITRIDVLPGPYVTFATDPELWTVDDREAQTYGAGAELELNQHFRNIGCELGDGFAPRYVTCSLCKVGSSPLLCHDTEISCFASGGTQAVVQTVIYPPGTPARIDPYQKQHLCDLTLPPAGVGNENLGLWELKGAFDLHPEEVSTLRFDLIEHGVPNLEIERGYSVEAVDNVGTPLGWLERDEPFNLQLKIRSEQYPVTAEQYSGVPVEVKASSLVYREAGIETTQLQTIKTHLEPTPIACFGGHVLLIPNLVITSDLLPTNAHWALLHLNILVDPISTGSPHGVVEEIGGESNTIYIETWIPVIDGSLGDLDAAIGSTIVADEFTGGGALSSPDLAQSVSWGIDTNNELLWLRYNPAGGSEPMLAWTQESSQPIGGVLTRYRRNNGFVNAPGLLAGGCDGDHQSGASLAGAENETIGDNQWHTALWYTDEREPFAAFSGLAIEPPLSAVTTCAASGNVTLYLGVETTCSDSTCTSYPETELDYLRAWQANEPAPLWDAVVTDLVYSDGSSWLSLPSTVVTGTGYELGLVVSGLVAHLAAVDSVEVIVSDQSPPETFQVGTPVVDGDLVIFPLLDSAGLLPTWTADDGDAASFTATIFISDPAEDPTGNSLQLNVSIHSGCETPLALPVGILVTR